MPPSRQTVAIVEDDASFNRALERLLNASGFATLAFASAEEFLASAKPNSYACVILDIHLPGISGLQLFDRLSADHGCPRVIFITAEDAETVRQEASRISGNLCLRKPLIAGELLDAVRQHLRCSGSSPE